MEKCREKVTIGDYEFTVRLMRGALTDPSKVNASDRGAKGSEWNRLMLPIHEQAINQNWDHPEYVEGDIPVWSHDLGSGQKKMYSDADLLTRSTYGGGSHSWCQETPSSDPSFRLLRGHGGVSLSSFNASSYSNSNFGWRPVLELH